MFDAWPEDAGVPCFEAVAFGDLSDAAPAAAGEEPVATEGPRVVCFVPAAPPAAGAPGSGDTGGSSSILIVRGSGAMEGTAAPEGPDCSTEVPDAAGVERDRPSTTKPTTSTATSALAPTASAMTTALRFAPDIVPCHPDQLAPVATPGGA